ncbi:MAG: hypothetical protein PWP31_1333 [Clostridia bacterium]|nr:hypothetical protein [Clostridia bacterium]
MYKLRSNQLENDILQRVDELIQCVISIGSNEDIDREEELNRGIKMVKEMGDMLLEVLEGREQHLQALLEQLVSQRLPDRRILKSFGNFSQDIQQIISQGVASYLKSRNEPENEDNDYPQQTETLNDSSEENSEETSEVDSAETEEVEKEEEKKEQKLITEEVSEEYTDISENNSSVEQELKCEKENTYSSEDSLDTTDSENKDQEEKEDEKLKALRLALLQAYPDEKIISNYQTRNGQITFYLPYRQLGFELETKDYDWRHEYFCKHEGIRIRKVSSDELSNPIYLARRLRREASWNKLT